jgi:hypothetical protein
MNTERIKRIAELAGVSADEAREFIEADWANADEHAAWLETASDKEIADWIAAGQE